jgi:hypothetical protein
MMKHNEKEGEEQVFLLLYRLHSKAISQVQQKMMELYEVEDVLDNVV